MIKTTLSTALLLSDVHGIYYAASFLCEAGVDIRVAIELLAGKTAIWEPTNTKHDSPSIALMKHSKLNFKNHL